VPVAGCPPQKPRTVTPSVVPTSIRDVNRQGCLGLLSRSRVAICAGAFLAVAEVDPWFSRESLGPNWSVDVLCYSASPNIGGFAADAARSAESCPASLNVDWLLICISLPLQEGMNFTGAGVTHFVDAHLRQVALRRAPCASVGVHWPPRLPLTRMSILLQDVRHAFRVLAVAPALKRQKNHAAIRVNHMPLRNIMRLDLLNSKLEGSKMRSQSSCSGSRTSVMRSRSWSSNSCDNARLNCCLFVRMGQIQRVSARAGRGASGGTGLDWSAEPSK